MKKSPKRDFLRSGRPEDLVVSKKLIYKCSTDPAGSNLENCIFVGLLLVDCRPTVIKVVGI